MKDKFYYVLKDCLSNRQTWVRETEIYFKHGDMHQGNLFVDGKGNIILKILHKLINLPLNSLLFIKKVKEYYEYNQTLKEIEIINSEIEKYELEKSKTGE